MSFSFPIIALPNIWKNNKQNYSIYNGFCLVKDARVNVIKVGLRNAFFSYFSMYNLYMIKDLLKEIEDLGTEQGKKIILQHGAKKTFGASCEKLKKIGRKNKTLDLKTTLDLFKTNVLDAQYLSLYIVNYSKRHQELTTKDFEELVKHAHDYMSREYVLGPLLGIGEHIEIIKKWSKELDNEAKSSSAFSGLAYYIRNNREYDDKFINETLKLAKTKIHDLPNRTRYALNSAVIAIGTYIDKYREKAIKISESYGEVDVVLGGKGCKVPYAPIYIPKAHERIKKVPYKKYYGC